MGTPHSSSSPSLPITLYLKKGGPVGAMIHEQDYSWYDNGGWLKPGLTLAMNGTGKPEPVGAAAGMTVNINVTATPLARPADIGREIAAVLGEFKKRGGMIYAPGKF